MAKLTFSKSYNNWTPGLLGRFDQEDVVTNDSKTFKLEFPGDYDDPSDLQGWSVSYKTTGTFKYSAGDGGVMEPVSGKVTSVEVRDEGGALVMKISDIKGVDIADIYTYIVNRPDSPGADSRMVMEYLMRGNDELTGTGGDDSFGLHDDAGNDTYKGKGGNDYFEVGRGNDKVDGGSGFDTMSYSNTQWTHTGLQGAVINLETRVAIDPWGDKDTFKNIEMFKGSRFADTFIGPDSDPLVFFGLKGGRGADSFKLEVDSNVYVIYSEDRWDGGHRGIIANLGGVKNGSGDVKGTIRDGFGHTDKTVNVHRVEGTDFADKFTGSRLNDHFTGRDGVDQYDGGTGKDWVHFDSDGGGPINVNLSLSSGQIIDDGYGNTESVTSIEAIIGSFGDDTIVGNSKNNEFIGGGGMDTLTGGGGADKFIFGNFHGNGFKDVITDFEKGKDKLVFDRAYIDGLDSTVRLINGDHATSKSGDSQFFFNADDHTLYLDTNGKKAGGVMQVAVLDGVTSLSKSDIVIVEHYSDIV